MPKFGPSHKSQGGD